MKKALLILALFCSLHSHAQTVFGCWYGNANVKTKSSANNYLVELILLPEKNGVTGILNYYFKNTYRSVRVKGDYDAGTRQLTLHDVPILYHASLTPFEVDCVMDLRVTLMVAKAGSRLIGTFKGLPDYRYTCPDIKVGLTLDAAESKRDSVIKAIKEFKEYYQVWKPSDTDSPQIAVNIIPEKLKDPIIEDAYSKRENIIANEIEVESDSLKVDFYDNGEIDGDSISVFLNNKLISSHQRLSVKAIHFDIILDSLKKENEITMFAENLGSIPPNTALMLIYDGKRRFDIRLSSSLEKNATIRIKRKKDGIKAPR